ncbi:adenylate/guanylate cyclase domain-containing protein [Nordella sp. HKS 07]|uniref:adenylate/guanylate cyclase domain-containing protein n=1 Tax=Nordella sp. HKS 07 TaxID=2712222 RepID=UPI0013E1119C|nr:adenylate/guanylate cyclase domain-containing protein [Nordella sp. HKS 07]QIG52244.1 adenylate/guanylate cyclase domain-containing protein [Nordella sp. HKS 07]
MREADVAAEKFVAVARMLVAVALLFAVEFAFSRGPTLDVGLVEARLGARIVIGILFLTGAVTYALLRFGFWSRWIAYVTVTIDILVIGLSLTGDLIDAQLPGRFAAALPTAVAALLVLAVGSLRLRPAVQIYSLVLMLALIVLALNVDTMIAGTETGTVGVAVYQFFGTGANIARLAMFILYGLVLIAAAWRGQYLLRHGLEEQIRRTNLVRYLPTELAPMLASGNVNELRSGRRARVAVLFIDIRNSVAMEEALDPARLVQVVSAFRSRVRMAAEQHGGIVDKFIGDGAFLVFGIPEPREDDARRAIACAKTILAMLAEWNKARLEAGEDAIRVGIGVHEGDAFIGAVGDDTRLEFTVLGDTVNVANRLEQATKEHDTPLIASADTVRKAGEDFAQWHDLGMAELRGRPEPLHIVGFSG